MDLLVAKYIYLVTEALLVLPWEVTPSSYGKSHLLLLSLTLGTVAAA